MSYRPWLVVGLALLIAGLAGCSYLGPNCGYYQKRVERTNALWNADRSVGIATTEGRCLPPRCWPLMANYGRKINETEEFFGTYFFNYDQNDPYRGNDLAEMGNFVGTHILMYNECDPLAGECGQCGLYCNTCNNSQPGCCPNR